MWRVQGHNCHIAKVRQPFKMPSCQVFWMKRVFKWGYCADGPKDVARPNQEGLSLHGSLARSE
jgi:hypothetical protein